MTSLASIIPVLLCGGAGTRLWPLSREGYPKQFLKLQGNKSLLQDTLLRIQQIPGIDEPTLISSHAHRFIVAEQAREVGVSCGTFILEPSPRNTAPAAAAAALKAMADGNDPILLLLPSDQLIRENDAFLKAISQGVVAALGGAIVTFGIVPRDPATAYGYIKIGQSSHEGVYSVMRFVEKPSREKAIQYIQEGNYLWNSGIFLVRASVYLEELERFAPNIIQSVKESLAKSRKDLDFLRLDSESFARCPSDSIDYAVMENTSRASVVPMNAEWSDLGSWDAVWAVAEKDEDGNAVRGDTLLYGAKDCLVHATHRLVAIAGLDSVLVVETPDAVLVIQKDRAQDVKNLVEVVRARGRGEAAEHRKVYRPWGAYDSVDQGPRYQVKRITVKPGAKLSLQMHHHRAEHWIVVSGTARIQKGDESYLLTENQSTYIPIGEVHSLENPGQIPLELIEVQSGSYLGEDDIIRLNDIYGR